MRLEHVNLTVTDLDRSVAFYRDILDFEVRWSGENELGMRQVHIGTDDYYLALFEGRNGQGDPPADDYYERGFNHFGLLVGPDDGRFEEIRDRVAERDIAISANEIPPGRRFYFHDPDGCEIEVAEYPTA